VIEYDPALTTNVLRIANTAPFGAPQSVGTVREAFSRLVPDNGFESVLAEAFGKITEGPMIGYDVKGEDLWDHLIGSAIASTRLAQVLQLSPPEHLFTAALTHDIGKVVLGTFPEIDAYGIIALALRDRVSFEEAERTILGIDHAEVGAFLAEHWGLPGSIVDAVRLHHQPELSLEHPLIVNLVHVADVVCLIVYDVLNELLKVRTLFKFRDEGCPQERPRGPFRSASRLPSFPFRPPNLYDVRALRGNLKAAGLQPVLTTFVQDANLPAARTPLSPDRTDYPADVPRIFC
jgi:putative nucleotidyltransferase with HDIG domain